MAPIPTTAVDTFGAGSAYMPGLIADLDVTPDLRKRRSWLDVEGLDKPAASPSPSPG